MAFQKASAEGGAKGGNRQDVMALDDVFLSIGEFFKMGLSRKLRAKRGLSRKLTSSKMLVKYAVRHVKSTEYQTYAWVYLLINPALQYHYCLPRACRQTIEGDAQALRAEGRASCCRTAAAASRRCKSRPGHLESCILLIPRPTNCSHASAGTFNML
ncbi:unnamed protein product [Ascophyllum nodosum]